MVREIRMNVSPASIPSRIDAHDRIPLNRYRPVPKAHIEAASQRSRGVAQINGNGLRPPGALLPKPGRGKSGSRIAAAPAAAMRKGVGSSGSAPPVKLTVFGPWPDRPVLLNIAARAPSGMLAAPLQVTATGPLLWGIRASMHPGTCRSIRVLSSLLVLLVADLIQPLDILAIHHIRDRDVAHGVGGGRAMPVFDTGGGPDHVTGLDLTLGAA